MTQIFKDYYEFSNRENKDINGVSESFAKNNPNWEKENETNKACWNCSRCSDCSGIRNEKNSKDETEAGFKVPVIENIHQKVFEASSSENALDMGNWHT